MLSRNTVDKLIIFSLFFLGLLNFLDAISTYLAISTGFAQESNPIMNGLISMGMEYFLLVKFSITLMLIFLGVYYNKRIGKSFAKKSRFYKYRYKISVIVFGLFVATIVSYLLIVINNFKIVFP